MLNELRDRNLLKGQCGECRYRFVCGGCRARAYSYFGGCLASDPGCPLVTLNGEVINSEGMKNAV